MLKITFFVPFLLFFVSASQTFGQTESYLSLYKDQLPYFQELITGGQFKEPPLSHEGDPYYLDRKFGEGSLSINRITYTEVPLLYDQYADLVVTFHPVYRQKILIKPEKIEEFDFVDGALFRTFSGNASYAHHKNGFYRVVKDGKVKVLKKHYKYLEPVKEVGKHTHRYVESSDYFYWYKGEFILIRKKKQAIKSLGFKKKDVKRHFREKSLYFSMDREKYILELASLRESKADTFEGFVK